VQGFNSITRAAALAAARAIPGLGAAAEPVGINHATVDQLTEVNGIGLKTLHEIRDDVDLGQ